MYIIDGGYLLHIYLQQAGQSFEQIFESYVDFGKSKQALYAVVIFDGQPKNITAMTTKFVEPERRSRKTIHNEVICNETILSKFSQGKFLAKDKKKNRLIALLISKFGSENMV